VGGFAIALLVFAGLAAAALWLLRRDVPGEQAPRWLRLATRQVTARSVFAGCRSAPCRWVFWPWPCWFCCAPT
jgi:hypothetical protein